MRRLLPVLLIACVLAVVPMAPSGAQESGTRSLTFATLVPNGSLIMRGMQAWSRELRRRTDNTLDFRFYPGGVQGDEVEVIRKIRSGRLDAGNVTATGLGHIYRPALVFQLPGVFLRYRQLNAARQALAPEIERGMIETGFRMLGWADIGRARIFSTHQIRGPRDMADRRVWVRTGDLLLDTLFTVVPTQKVELSVPEVLGALGTNRVDTFFAPPVVAAGFQWASRTRYMTDLPLAVVIGGTVISESVFGTLTDEQKTALTETGHQFHALARRNAERMENESVQALLNHGIEVVHPSIDDMLDWRDIGGEVRQRVEPQIGNPSLVRRAVRFGEGGMGDPTDGETDGAE